MSDPVAAEEAIHRAAQDADWWSGDDYAGRPVFPEPPELTAWAEQQAVIKADKERHNSALCATCGKRRDHNDHAYVASRLGVRCRFTETP